MLFRSTWKLSCPGALMNEWHDQYGNCCHTLTVPRPVTELSIRVSGLVRTRDTTGVVGFASAELPLELYLRETPYTLCSEPIRDYAARFRRKAGGDVIETLHEIMSAIAADVEYRPGETMCTRPEPKPWSRAAASARTTPIFSAPSAARLASQRAMSAATWPRAKVMHSMPRAMPGPTPMSTISAG